MIPRWILFIEAFAGHRRVSELTLSIPLHVLHVLSPSNGHPLCLLNDTSDTVIWQDLIIDFTIVFRNFSS